MTWQRRIRSFLYVIVVAGLVLFLLSNKKLFLSLKYISLIDLVFLLLFSLVASYLNALQFRYMAEVFDVNLKFKEWFGLAVANTMHNYYTPARGGTVLKAIYLKKSCNLAYSNFISLAAGAYLFGCFMASLSAVFFIVLYFILYNEFYGVIFSVASLLLVATLLTGFVAIKIEFSQFFKRFQRLYNFVSKVESGLVFFLKRKNC